MTGQSQDFCSYASASEIVSRLEHMSDKAIDITDIEGKKALDYALKNAKVTDNAEILRMLGLKTETESVSLDTPTEIESDNVKLPEDISTKSEAEEPVVNDVKVNVESKKTPATDPTTISEDSEPDPKPVHESRIMPDEFMRMCAGASFEMILNAIENRNANVNAKDYYDVTPIMYSAEIISSLA